MEIKLSSQTKSLLVLLKERLNASESEVVEEAILCLFRESQSINEAEKVVDYKQPTPLIEVMEKSGLLD